MTTFNRLLLLLFFLVLAPVLRAQIPQQRIDQIHQELKDLAKSNPGLNEKVDFSVSGATVQEFLRGLAESNNLNISVDPSLTFRIYNNFTNEKVMNILLFLVKEYDLDIQFIGSIMSFHAYDAPIPPEPVAQEKEINVKYNNYNNLITLDLTGDTLWKVAKKITQQTRKNVILSDGLADKVISVYIQDAPFENAMEKMAFANNLKVVKTKDDFYVIKNPEEGEDLLSLEGNTQKQAYNNPFPPFDKNKSQNNNSSAASGQNAGNNTNNVYVNVITDSLNQPLVSVEALNAPIGQTIKTVAAAVGVSYFLFSEVKGNTTLRVLNVLFDDFLKRLLQGTDFTFKKNNNLYLIGDRKLEGLRVNKVVQLQYRTVKEVMDVIPSEIKKGVELKEFVELNSVLLTGSLPQIEEIEAFIKALDKVVPMVLIDVILLDIRKNNSIQTGISAGLDSTSGSSNASRQLFPGLNFTFSSKSINSFLSWLGSNNAVNLGRVTPDFYVNLKALEQNSNVNVRSTPKLSTLNGHKATLSIGSTRYYTNTTQNVMGSLKTQTVVTRQFHQVQANLAITIDPVVSGDDQVTLDITVHNSDFLEATSNQPPPQATSQFNSMIRVRNEEMIVLGGLERYQKSTSNKGFPLISRIPILKWIFSAHSNSRSKTITVVFIKPTIIY